MNELVEQIGREGGRGREIDFEIGDTVDVHVRIREGDKERIQVFSGTVIAMKGSGVNQAFTVRRIVQDEGVERVFPINSPDIVEVVVKRHGRVRRAKLYYLRHRVGRGRRLAERRRKTPSAPTEAVTPPAAETDEKPSTD